MKIREIVGDKRDGYTDTIWITKYALTQGIVKVENARIGMYDKAVYYKDKHLVSLYPEEWCATNTEAFRKAEEMRDKKIESFKKQIAKLEAMVFDMEEE